MKAFNLEQASDIIIGINAWKELKEYLLSAEFKTIAVVTDDNLTKLFWNRFQAVLPQTSKIFIIDGPSQKKIGISYDFPVECVIGFGGGTNIDQAKMIALKNEIKLIIVPTKPTAAIYSRVASIPTLEGRATIPTPKIDRVFIDPTINVPIELLQSEYGDMLSSWSAIPDAIIADIKNKESAKNDLLIEAYKRGEVILLLEDLSTAESHNVLYQLSIEIGVIGDLYGSTRPSSGTEHKISHALDEYLPKERAKLHGVQVSLGVLCSLYLQEQHRELQKQLALRSFKKLHPEDLAQHLKQIGLPTSFADLGLTREESIIVLKNARTVRPEPRYTIVDEFTDSFIIQVITEKNVIPSE